MGIDRRALPTTIKIADSVIIDLGGGRWEGGRKGGGGGGGGGEDG